MTKKIEHIDDLTESLCTLFEQSAGENRLPHQVVKEMNNTAGKIIATQIVQLKQHALAKTTPDLKFLRSKSNR